VRTKYAKRQKDAKPKKKSGLQLVKRKSEKDIDQGKTSPTYCLEQPISSISVSHSSKSNHSGHPGYPLNIPVGNWFYKWEAEVTGLLPKTLTELNLLPFKLLDILY
jgi:hypothetical protein